MSGRGESKGKSSEMGTVLLNSESSRKSVGLCEVCMERAVVGSEVREAARNYAV